jgi:hypothetical protein
MARFFRQPPDAFVGRAAKVGRAIWLHFKGRTELSSAESVGICAFVRRSALRVRGMSFHKV